ncbi:HAMP domain-containing protein [Leptolyngbya sp. FACHB-36]|nr:HAMP domain-containing protein [Leptolyngbya sp. FACHB-36]
MGFGSRSQSDNPAIVEAARAQSNGSPLNKDLQEQVKKILQNEVKAGRMEYATLVGKDTRIIVNANADRKGEPFDPGSLVSEMLKNPQQIKASEVVPWTDLLKEAAPLPEGFGNRDALIRYVVTPVRDPNSRQVVGALVFGDIVNDKRPIVEATLNAFGSGYSAVYLQQDSGFSLATALERSRADEEAQADISLPDTSLLEQAAAAKGQVVTERLDVRGRTYTVAAKAVPNQILETPDGPSPVYSDRPTAILVRGTPENSLNQLLKASFQQEAVVLFLSVMVIILWSLIFRYSILRPLQNLKQATQAFTTGNRTVRTQVFSNDEVGQLAQQFNRLADRISASESALASEAARQEQQAKEAKALSDIIVRIRRSLKVDSIAQVAVEEVRELLRVDRVIILQFQPDSLVAEVIAEVQYGKSVTLGQTVQDPLGLETPEQYAGQQVWHLSNVANEAVNDRHRAALQQFEANAELVATIQCNGQRFGLLCAHSCAEPRLWEGAEINLLSQIAAQIGYALDQAQLLSERQAALYESEQRKEALQQQILTLLNEVEGASHGDLTVRADVTVDDLGTVADFFNSIIESLRDLVTQVKQSAAQVNTLLGENEGAMQQLAEESRRQAADTTHILNSVEEMSQSIATVASSAHQAATVARAASSVAEMGDAEMDATVQSIQLLRETIDATAQQVRQLGSTSEQISRVVSIINDIAVQTDLLAINAGIEATRAGEHGRGFTIVATEVGELAARSTTATREIEQIVQTIQREITAVVAAMERGTRQVAGGSHAVKNARQSLLQIVRVSHEIDTLVQSISETTVSQAETSRSVTQLVKNVAQVSGRTLDASYRVVGALRETVNVAQSLQDSVETFKVE